MKFHIDGSVPEANRIFVFGSNQSGIHGAGAARVAYNHFGAVWGRGVGKAAESYAIPTKDFYINTLPLHEVDRYVSEFVEFTKRHPEYSFFVTRVGCGLASFSDNEMAPMFKGAINCSFAEQWKRFLI